MVGHHVATGTARATSRPWKSRVWEWSVTSAMVRAMASLSSMAPFISASARLLLNWLKSSHCWRVEELRQETLGSEEYGL